MPDDLSPRFDPDSASAQTVLNGANAAYVSELYARFTRDPSSVDQSWRSFFGALSAEARDSLTEVAAENRRFSWQPPAPEIDSGDLLADWHPSVPEKESQAPMTEAAIGGMDEEQLRAATLDSIRALMMIRAFRVRGHLEARLDPLDLEPREEHPELDPASYGFAEEDWDRPIFINHVLGLEYASVREMMKVLHETYCGSIGVEFMHIQEPDQKDWIQRRIEGIHNTTDFTERGQKAILERITAAEAFEQYLHKKFIGTKRFGLDGGEAMIPAIEQIMKRGGQLGLEEIVIGMAHRGRLNVLANVMGKPFRAIFSEFQGTPAHPEDVQGSGDVKYHLGSSSDRDFDGNTVHLSLTANPSHLEAVNPVVIGKVRAKQKLKNDTDRTKVLSLLLHGDAAFAGQGLVAETLAISELKGYRIGGTIHFVINNQIGFTTAPKDARSGPYSTDVAKMIQAPIFHVNGDDPEAVVHVARIAIEFRQKFQKDVVIDMFCYRRFGHNEGDEPAFTQPLMYQRIAKHPTTREIFASELEQRGLIPKGEGDKIMADTMRMLDEEFDASSSYRPNKADWLDGRWQGLSIAEGGDRRGQTAVPLGDMRRIGTRITEVPEDFAIHSKIARQLKAKRQMLESGEGIDWATAEALAFGTLVDEGIAVRLSGQDSGRGTFSQRHAVLYDQNSAEKHIPLQHVRDGQGMFEVIDSPLSEAAVMGFEYGYSLAEPHALVMWEAQFGDFANGAQVIIDQFIASGEAKWLRMSGLVLLLPHGYEGQGPEHSSARLERFLQLCGEDNIQVANCTTPANYFHILRRQVHRNFRKPLVIMTPKSLLRHKQAVSPLSMMTEGTTFHRVLYDEYKLVAGSKVKRVVLCSGKVYYDLAAERAERDIKDVALVRVEQLYPFPANALSLEIKKYPKADIVWCQEEPANMGAWSFIAPKLEALLVQMKHKGASRPIYAGRAEAASTATGLLHRHNEQQAALVDEALTVADS